MTIDLVHVLSQLLHLSGISTVKPAGTEATIRVLPTYIAQQPDGVPPKALALFHPGVHFEWDFVNDRILCDTCSRESGFLVWQPDFMNVTAPPKLATLRFVAET
ncbi:hypothetical protein ACRE_016040 [Hapsidospora chrysogenum ATCC 11550]|uniref:Uncharacterized protein n=1 Tax=Hapsidospora chrysogenum (strain ATCC 11550 / CBS 779.69 / DSM 880 / IAM 14645 / JCM 23072 / IMI 49137) TaxID=857340 RepID=A0A086TDS4_HAPC1|nr:hypothetical protein ACRE_016040 [Hapsidospora chrysogenum ATCC 11550]